MKLEILISTINDNINNAYHVCKKQRNDLKYTIVHQITNKKEYDYTIFKKRKDIKVISMREGGVTKSRNVAILNAEGDICLFSDDDVLYKEEYFNTLYQYFKNNLKSDVCIFKIETPEGQEEYSDYENYSYRLNKSIGVGTIQIAFRLKSIQEKKIYFDERFGAGNEYLIGADEKIFIHDCIESGLNVYYYPAYIVQHPYESTQKILNKYDYANARLAGGVSARTKGFISIVITYISFIKHFYFILKEKKNPFIYIYNRIHANTYVLRTNKKYKDNYKPNHKISIEKEFSL